MPSATTTSRRVRGIHFALQFPASSVAGAIALIVLGVTSGPLSASATSQTIPLAQPVPGSTSLTSVSCPSSTFCVAIGSDGDVPVVVPITDGSAGTPEGIPGFGQPGTPTDMVLNSVTCTSSLSCTAVGEGVVPDPPSRVMGVGVIVPITAGAPDGVVQVSGVGQIGVPDTIYLNGVACSSARSCVAVGWDLYLGAVVLPITNGSVGSEVPAQVSSLNGVFCRPSGGCKAVGSGTNGGVLVPLANGTIGTGGGTVAGVNDLAGVACRVGSGCLAVGDSSVVVPMTKSNPGTGMPVSGASGLSDVACNGTTFCLAVGATTSNEGAMVRIASAKPGIARAVPGSSGLNGIACPSLASCVAVGQDASHEGVFDALSLSPGG